MTASIGAGAALLRAVGLRPRLDRSEAVAWAFPLGMGLIGWVVFFLAAGGAIERPILLTLLVSATPGLFFLWHWPARVVEEPKVGSIWWLLWFFLIASLAIDFVEALAPPADADSLAYHFALPKQFLTAGRLEFVPRGADGAIPLLVQMTWMVALALGGEQGMTLWVGISGAMGGLLTYAIARSYMDRSWALAVTVIFLSTPAVVYGAGTGQTEVRLALFAAVAACAMAQGITSRHVGFVIVAGFATGFCIATKYTGLLIATAVALPLILLWRSPKAWLAYSVAALGMGFQWYLWNWWHAGDPLFPVLFSALGLPDNDLWSVAQDSIFRATHSMSERPLPVTLFWLIAYPFHATLWPIADIESGRTGLGPYGILILPFLLSGIWKWRNSFRDQSLLIIALICLIFYVLWFISGVSQRVRHLLPVWPLFLIAVTVLAIEGTRLWSLRRPLAAAASISILIQIAGQTVFGISYFQHFFSGEGREAFLRRSISFYDFVPGTESVMNPGDRVLIEFRQLNYLFTKPVFYFHNVLQAQVVARTAKAEPAAFLKQLRSQHITLLLVAWPQGTNSNPSDLAIAADTLLLAGCLVPERSLSAAPIGSRTLKGNFYAPIPATLYRVKEDSCRL